jgi:hypothetical protein
MLVAVIPSKITVGQYHYLKYCSNSPFLVPHRFSTSVV